MYLGDLNDYKDMISEMGQMVRSLLSRAYYLVHVL